MNRKEKIEVLKEMLIQLYLAKALTKARKESVKKMNPFLGVCSS